MALIESLDIVLALSTNKMATGTKAAKGMLTDLNAAARSTKAMIAGVLGGIGVGLSLNAIKNLTAESFANIDAMADVADRLQLSTEALGGFQHAANMAGVEAEMLVSSLDKMAKNIGGIEGDSDDLAKTLANMGLNFRDLQAVGTEEAFLRIGEATNKLGNAFSRSAAITDIFGKSGGKLLNVFAGGRAGVEEMVKEFEELNGAFSRVDAAQVQAADDAINRLKVAVSGLGNDLAIAFSPLIAGSVTDMTDNFVELNKAVKETGVDMGKLSDFAVIIAGVGDNINAGFQYAQVSIIEFVADVVSGMDMAGQHVAKFFAKVAAEANVLDAMAQEYISGVAHNLRELAVLATGSLSGSWLENTEGGANLAAAQAATAAAREAARTAGMGDPVLSEFSKSLQEQAKAARDEFDKMFMQPTMAERLEQTYARMAAEAEKRAKAAAEAAKRENEVAAAMEDQEKAAKATEKAVKDAADAAKKLADEGKKMMEANMTPMEEYTKKVEDAYRLMLGGAIDEKTFNREAMRLQGEFNSANTPKIASATLAGSDAAERIIAANQNRGQFKAPTIENLLKDGNKELREQNKALKQIDENLRNNQDAVFKIA